METAPITVSAAMSIRDLVENYFYRYHYKMFPVTRDGMLLGCVTARRISHTPQEQWEGATVTAVLERCSPENTIMPHADAMDALNQMSRTGNSRLMVIDGERLVGIITLEDMLDFLAMKLDLESQAR